MTTIILSNGHYRTDDIEAGLEKLLELLAYQPLNRAFEKFGGFIEHDARGLRGQWLEGVENAVNFFGGFLNRSHIFCIVTNEPDMVKRLTDAISTNRQRPDYLRQPPPYYPDKLVIERKRFSVTQGEVLLTYDGQRIEQYGDRIRLDGSGGYVGHDDDHWHEVAERALERRHVEAFERALIAQDKPPAA